MRVPHDRQGKTQAQVDDSTVFCVIALFGILGCIGLLAIFKLVGVM